MKKHLLLLFFSLVLSISTNAQRGNYWNFVDSDKSKIAVAKTVNREGYPSEFKLFRLNIEPLREALFSTNGENISKKNVIITLPNAQGQLEDFEVYETSNFDAALQARFPNIRAYSGRSITDPYATLKLSIAPEGIQTMVFRADKPNEFIEVYSEDHKTYSVFKSQRQKGKISWICSTKEQKGIEDLNNKVSAQQKSNDSNLRTMRLALSCVGEYAAAFGASTAGTVADQNIVLARFNATMARVNGVFEKDFGLHLNIINQSTNVIFYNAGTDPYSAGAAGANGAWNAELQNTLSSRLTGVGSTLAANNAAYDIGHLFGASGGGGNAGCIGCVCRDDTSSNTDSNKGSGFTSPSAGLPQGDNFDIDYVAHEMGHQLGGNHTFSNNSEGTGVNVEVGSGISIMGYAGITGFDLAPHSIDKFHAASIQQVQANLQTKACPVVTNIAANNATPVANAGLDYTIPKTTPFQLTGAGNDANAADALTYSWEQMDNCGPYTGADSNASLNKKYGPNWTSLQASASSSRYFPNINSIVANLNVTLATGNDAAMLSEALSAVSRPLNFRLTVRDNATYNAVAPFKVGQTAFDDMKVTVNDKAGPFVVNIPSNTGISWAAGSSQMVTWNVAGTTANNVNASEVDIFLSTDGGFTYPIQLANRVTNDGSETILVPNNVGTTNRIMVRGNNHIFFDISNNNFAITAPSATFVVAPTSAQTALVSCAGAQNTTSYTFNYTALGGFSGTTTFSATGLPAGANVVFSPATLNVNGPVTMTVNNVNAVSAGAYTISITATSGATIKTLPVYLNIGIGATSLSFPADAAIGLNPSTELNWSSVPNATSYDVQIATNPSFVPVLSTTNVIGTSLIPAGLVQGTTYYWRVLPKNGSCSGVYTPYFRFATANVACATTTNNTAVAIPINNPNGFSTNSTLNIPTNAIISDVNVTVNATHTYIGDLTLILKSPTGTLVQLFSEGCSDIPRQNMAATFDDSGNAIVCGAGPAPAAINGVVRPDTALSIFNGENASGTWTLNIQDGYDGDGGSITSWSLNICTLQQVPLGSEEFAFKDFSLYPNPNNGSFNVNFTPVSNDVKVCVYDIRGRQIYEKKYTSNGYFNSTIDLNNTSKGVYVVAIFDGDKKIVKKIVIE